MVVLVAGGLVRGGARGQAARAPRPCPGATPARLGIVDSNRYRYWEEAGSTFAEHPLIGIGSGGFQVEWLKVDKRFDASGDAHSLYLETAAELGVVGVAFLLLFLGGVGAAVLRLYRIDPRAGAGLAAGPGRVGLPRGPGLGLGDARGDACPRCCSPRRPSPGASGATDRPRSAPATEVEAARAPATIC